MHTTREAHDPAANKLLASLPQEDYERILPHLGPVAFSLGEVVYESGARMDHIYFPTTAVISLPYVMENGSSAEMGMAGNEGLVGVALFMGGGTMPNRAVVQGAGGAVRMRAKVLQEEFARGGAFRRLLLRYTQAFLTQVPQVAACNRAHTPEERLAKWLLMCQDRAHSKGLELTHEFIAEMLGIRRAGVTEAAYQFREAGLIHYRRGRVTIVNRAGLEAASCECCPILKKSSHGSSAATATPRKPHRFGNLSG